MGLGMPDNFPFCSMMGADGNPYWSEFQYQQKLAFDVMRTKIKCGKGGGMS